MRRTLLIAILCLFAASAHGQPDLSRKRLLHGILICPDAKQSNAFYYLPNDLAVKRTGGMPELRFLMMRYTGSASTGDQGTFRYRNILQFDVAMTPCHADSLALAKRDLQRVTPRLAFGPLPIHNIEAVVHYTPAEDTASTRLGKGDLEANSPNGESTAGAYWLERTFTLSVDNPTAQLFDHSLKKGMLVLSVGYAFFSKGKIEGDPEISGTARDHPRFRRMMEEILAKPDSGTTESSLGVVHAGAFEIAIDTTQYTRFVRQVDLNDWLPPDYSVLSVYNYDFNNALRPDLFEKLVEVEAVGAGGGTVQASAEFRFNQPELYSRSIRFKYAVQLTRPYRYRVREISLDGEEKVSDWISVREWTPILDVTTR